MIPEVLRWKTDRAAWLNVLCVVLALALVVVEVAAFVLSAFVGAVFGLALKK